MCKTLNVTCHLSLVTFRCKNNLFVCTIVCKVICIFVPAQNDFYTSFYI